jgi:hypothetical protein
MLNICAAINYKMFKSIYNPHFLNLLFQVHSLQLKKPVNVIKFKNSGPKFFGHLDQSLEDVLECNLTSASIISSAH